MDSASRRVVAGTFVGIGDVGRRGEHSGHSGAGSAVVDACEEHNLPYNEGQPSRSNVDCTSPQRRASGRKSRINDYADAEWHGAPPRVSVTVCRSRTAAPRRRSLFALPDEQHERLRDCHDLSGAGLPARELSDLECKTSDHRSIDDGRLPGAGSLHQGRRRQRRQHSAERRSPVDPRADRRNCNYSKRFAVLVANSRTRASSWAHRRRCGDPHVEHRTLGPRVGMRVRAGTTEGPEDQT